MASSVAADKKQTDGERHTNQHNVNPSAAAGSLPGCISNFCAFNSFRRRFKCPCDDQSDRKTDDEEENYQAHYPIGDFEKWKNLASDLHQQPCDNRIRGCHFVDVAPLKFGKKIVDLHFLRS